MKRLTTFITGDDYQMAKNADPLSRRKIAIMASLLMVPSTMWLVNGYLIANNVLSYPLSVALAAALGCAVLIFIIERAIIHVSGFWVNIFRLFLGLLVAVIGSIGWDEVIFKSDIDNHMIKYVSGLVEKEQEEKSRHLMELITRQEDMVERSHSEWRLALTEALHEADGTGGSMVRGISNITRMKMEAAEQKKALYETGLEKLSSMRGDFAMLKESVERDVKMKFNEHSLLLRIKLLLDMAFSDKYTLIPYILITMLLVVLEFIVVIYKWFSPKTAYDYRLEAIEKVTMNRISMMAAHADGSYDPVRETERYQGIMRTVNQPLPELFDN